MKVSEKFNPSFETFGDTKLIAMLDRGIAFTEAVSVGAKPHWLCLLGTSGAGKTYLAKQIWKWFRASELFRTQVKDDGFIYPGQFCSWRKAADEILGGSYFRVNELCTETFVVLDDIGAEYKDKSGIVKSKLDRILDERLGKWTVITCNYSLAKIASEMDTRIASRMMRGGSQIVDIETADFNLRRKAA